MKLCFAILFAVVAILLGLYINTLHTTPHVSKEQIEADGGHYLFHNDRVIEYFLCGDPSGVPLVFFHGAGSTGEAVMWMDKLAKKYHYRFISISCPGTGGSSPIVGRGYFEGARDTVAVLDHLGYSPNTTIHIMGVSYGSGTSAALAQLIPQRVRSLQLIVPAWPSMGEYNMFDKTPLLNSLLSYPFLDRIYSYYISKVNINLTEVLRVVAPDEFAEVEKEIPGFLDLGDKDYKRATKYHHEGSCELPRIMRSKGIEIYEKMEILQSLGSKVSIWYGLKDIVAPSNAPGFLISKLPKARVFAFEKGHLGMLIDMSKYFEEMKLNDEIQDQNQDSLE